MEPVRGKGETNSGTVGSVSGLRYGPFGIAGSGIILTGAAGAPIGNWPVTVDDFLEHPCAREQNRDNGPEQVVTMSLAVGFGLVVFSSG